MMFSNTGVAREGRGRSLTRRILLAAACFAGLGAVVAPATAQEWPTRPVTIVVPFPAGGNTDTMARLAADYLTRSLGQNFIVENRPTAGGVVADSHEYGGARRDDGRAGGAEYCV